MPISVFAFSDELTLVAEGKCRGSDASYRQHGQLRCPSGCRLHRNFQKIKRGTRVTCFRAMHQATMTRVTKIKMTFRPLSRLTTPTFFMCQHSLTHQKRNGTRIQSSRQTHRPLGSLRAKTIVKKWDDDDSRNSALHREKSSNAIYQLISRGMFSTRIPGHLKGVINRETVKRRR